MTEGPKLKSSHPSRPYEWMKIARIVTRTSKAEGLGNQGPLDTKTGTSAGMKPGIHGNVTWPV